MDELQFAEWVLLGERLQSASPERFAEVAERLTRITEAQEVISGFDHHLFFRGRPRKKYVA